MERPAWIAALSNATAASSLVQSHFEKSVECIIYIYIYIYIYIVLSFYRTTEKKDKEKLIYCVLDLCESYGDSKRRRTKQTEEIKFK